MDFVSRERRVNIKNAQPAFQVCAEIGHLLAKTWKLCQFLQNSRSVFFHKTYKNRSIVTNTGSIITQTPAAIGLIFLYIIISVTIITVLRHTHTHNLHQRDKKEQSFLLLLQISTTKSLRIYICQSFHFRYLAYCTKKHSEYTENIN